MTHEKSCQDVQEEICKQVKLDGNSKVLLSLMKVIDNYYKKVLEEECKNIDSEECEIVYGNVCTTTNEEECSTDMRIVLEEKVKSFKIFQIFIKFYCKI